MAKTQDFVIGRDIVLAELEPLTDLLASLPHKVQFGPRNLVGHVWDKTKEHGVKNLFHALRDRAHDNFKSLKVEYTCLDTSFDAIVLGTNLGIIFLFDRTCKKLSRLPSEVTHEPARCVQLLPAHSYAAVGFDSGLITIFSFVLASQGFGKPQTMHVSGAHNSPVTCLEWSPDGELLYSGDVAGKVYVTVTKVQEGLTQTAMSLQEPSPIVQLSFSWSSLLISSEKRTILWDFRNEKVIQVGQKERKSPGQFGAMFYPPSRGAPEDKSQPSVYTSRPGLRLWTADVSGKVSATLMYKGLTNESPPGITILNPPPPCVAKPSTDHQPQFGPLRLFHGQFFVTWDVSRLWVLDTSPCALVGYHGNLGDVVDVSTSGHEIYVLQRGGDRMLIKLCLIPKLSNPLLDVVALLEHSYKSEEEDNVIKKEAESSKHGKPISKEKTAESVCDRTADSSTTEMLETVKEIDPFKKYQDIRHQDFGDIVFRKQKRSKKKANKDPSSKEVLNSPEEVKVQPATIDVSPSPASHDKHEASDLPDGPDPSVNRWSSISSDFDSVDKCSESSSGQNQDSEGEGEEASAEVHLMVVHVTQNGRQEKHFGEIVNCGAGIMLPDSRNGDEVVAPQASCVTCVTDVAGDVMSELLSASPPSAAVSDDTLSPQNSVCMNSVSLSTSTLIERDRGTEDTTFSPERSYQADHLPKIYSDTPVNISDATISDSSVEKSHLYKSRVGDSSTSALSSLPRRPSSDILTDSEGTPPVSLDSEGAEELSDTASWPWPLSKRTMIDLEIVSPEDVPPLEGSFSSTSSGSSLSRSPGSTKIGLRLLADSWADYSPPGQGYVQFVAVSDMHIWCVTSYDHIYYCPTHFSVVTWTQLRGSARMISVNNAGDVIWCIDKKNCAFARIEISTNHLTGKRWQPVEKNMRHLAVDNASVWGIKLNGDVFVRTDVSREHPTGKGWRTISVDTKFMQVSCFDGLAWFLDSANHIHVYKGANTSRPSENGNWEILPGCTINTKFPFKRESRFFTCKI